MTWRDPLSRQEALIALLALPDEPCLRRSYRYTQVRRGDPDVIKRDLGTAYVAHRRQDLGKDISCVVSVRRQPLRLVRKA